MPTAPPSPLARIFKFFTSFGLATTTLVLLLLVTWLGTLEQREYGLYKSQEKYFESLFITNIDIGCCVRAMQVPEMVESLVNHPIFTRKIAFWSVRWFAMTGLVLGLMVMAACCMIGFWRSVVSSKPRDQNREMLFLLGAGVCILLGTVVSYAMQGGTGFSRDWGALIRNWGTVPILLPGGALLMTLLAVNMICGGITRLTMHIINRYKHGTKLAVFGLVGVLIAHVSVVFLLLAGLVSLWYKQEGAVWITEGSRTNEFDSFHRSAIQIEKLAPAPADGKRVALIIPDDDFADLKPSPGVGKSRTFASDNLPFDLVVMNYLEHSAVRRAAPGDAAGRVVDGYVLQELPLNDPETGKPIEHERLMNGAYVKAVDKKTGAEQRGIVWRMEAAPWSVKIGDEIHGVSLGRRTYALPFTVQLDKFVQEVHPGTSQARKFASHVTVVRDGQEEQKLITMNEPLRYGGYAFFQSSFDSMAAQRGGPQSSMFQVASNPSDHWPLISLLAVMLGLAMNLVAHFLKFVFHASRGGSPAGPSPTPTSPA